MNTISFHNPDGLSPEQVGDGWRLLESDETIGVEDRFWVKDSSVEAGGYWKEAFHTRGMKAGQCEFTFRRPTTPGTPAESTPPPSVVLPEGWRWRVKGETVAEGDDMFLPHNCRWTEAVATVGTLVTHDREFICRISPDTQSPKGAQRPRFWGRCDHREGKYWVMDGEDRIVANVFSLADSSWISSALNAYSPEPPKEEKAEQVHVIKGWKEGVEAASANAIISGPPSPLDARLKAFNDVCVAVKGLPHDDRFNVFQAVALICGESKREGSP